MHPDHDLFYLNREEPYKSCFLSLRDIILGIDKEIEPAWKYNLPFFYFRGKMFCYLWMDKRTKEPYVGIVEGNRIDHPALEKGDRKRIKIYRVDPGKDIKLKELRLILNMALDLYKTGVVKVKEFKEKK